MIGVTLFTVFALGLRHGADPDHLAAIDNVTRNATEQRRRLSRFVGSLFAGGHTVMVIAIAGVSGWLGARLGGTHVTWLETAGTMLSIAVLLAFAVGNLRRLIKREDGIGPGLRSRLLPAFLRESTHPLVAVPIGMLFGLGFETPSQLAAYASAMASGSGVSGALIIGVCFCLGMICTDTVDSLLVYRFVADRRATRADARRTWVAVMTAFALGVAVYNAAQLAGWKAPLTDLAVSGIMVGIMLAVFAAISRLTRRPSYQKPH